MPATGSVGPQRVTPRRRGVAALEAAYRLAVINTFGGGANELQRDTIAMAGLGMSRAPRDLSAPDKGGPSQ